MSDKEEIQEGIPLDRDELFWIAKMRVMAGNSIKAVEDAAKQLVAMITVLQGLYAGVLAFSGIRVIPKNNPAAIVFYALPILLWLVALAFALNVFKARKYSYTSGVLKHYKAAFRKIANYKHRSLNLAYTFIFISVAVAMAGIMYWLYTGAPAESAPHFQLQISF